MAYPSYDRVAIFSYYKLLLRQQADHIPLFTDQELQRLALICHHNRVAVAESLEGIKSIRFEMLCDYIASRGVPISDNTSDTVLTIATAALIGVAISYPMVLLARRLDIAKRCQRIRYRA